jgi:hypothetical protein
MQSKVTNMQTGYSKFLIKLVTLEICHFCTQFKQTGALRNVSTSHCGMSFLASGVHVENSVTFSRIIFVKKNKSCISTTLLKSFPTSYLTKFSDFQLSTLVEHKEKEEQNKFHALS